MATGCRAATTAPSKRLRRTGLSAALCGALAWPFSAGAGTATAPRAYFDYLYIEANSGSSAGGHVAIRFGDIVYHYQHAEPGIVRPYAQSWSSFDLAYRGLGNRPIHLQRVGLSVEGYGRLRDGFQRRLLVVDSHVEALEKVQRDGDLLDCLAGDFDGKSAEGCGLELAGAGYFGPESATRRRISQQAGQGSPVRRCDFVDHFITSPDLSWKERDEPPGLPADEALPGAASLRRRIEAIYGENFLSSRDRELRRQIEELHPTADDVALPETDVVARLSPSFADRYANLLLELLAVRVLEGKLVTRSDGFRTVDEALTPNESNVLSSRIEPQRERVVRLLASSRSDRGYPLLIALARLAALEASLATGTLVVLDTYTDTSPSLPPAALAEYAPVLREIAAERSREMNEARTAAFSAAPEDEAVWSRFEASANVALETEESLAGRRALRLHPPTLTPAKAVPMNPAWPKPRLGADVLAAAQMDAAAREQALEERLRQLYRYDLVRRNCVTEILAVVDENVVDDDGDGRLDSGINFIPFVSADAVREAYGPLTQLRLPSYREVGLERMRQGGFSWIDALRESTAYWSTLIPLDTHGEVFLFFTDDRVATRPLLGLANVIVGSAAAAGGVLTLPFDGGELISAGARGVFYSLPEVTFVNIRKGEVVLLPPSWDGGS